jgi:hypothetical protein
VKLVEEIIDLLSREDPNIENALTKTKVLLYRLGEDHLAGWVSAELNGYTGSQEVPGYRIIPTRVLASVTDGITIRYPSTQLPLGHLPEQMRTDLRNTKVGHSVATLQQFAAAKEDSLSKPLSPELYRLLAKGLTKGFIIESAHVEIARSQIIGILAQIKSRLLDFILQVSTRMPSDITDSDARTKSKEIDISSLFQSAIFGDNTTIIVGNHNTQTVKNIAIKAGDFRSLAEHLRAHRVSEPDIANLRSAIDQDGENVDRSKRQPGSKVKEWMKVMLAKAVDTSWQIEIGVASSLLASALGQYYGWF